MTLVLAFAIAPPMDCIAVRNDRIFGRDIAVADPSLAEFPAALPLGYAPAPGVRRVIAADVLRRLAKNQGVALSPASDVCLERPVAEMTDVAIREAMASPLAELAGGRGAVTLDLIEWGPKLVPEGKLVFPASGLRSSGGDPKAPSRWHGYILSGDNRRTSVWVTVKTSLTSTRVVATTALTAGRPILPGQVRVEECQTSVLEVRVARDLDEVLGYLPKNLIPAGASILRGQLTRVPDVAIGDLVHVEVAAGAARLTLEAKAQSSGNVGGSIWVRNLSSGKEFQGMVVAKDKIVVGDGTRKEQWIR